MTYNKKPWTGGEPPQRIKDLIEPHNPDDFKLHLEKERDILDKFNGSITKLNPDTTPKDVRYKVSSKIKMFDWYGKIRRLFGFK